jgi:asparagine synthase (glutamine-hydrolysing)
MCGITGYLQPNSSMTVEDSSRLCAKMTEALVHRGPDAGGVWVDAAQGVALGHRRLSIIDLSESGAQPMVSASKRFVLAFNGEIYNFADLRIDLEANGYPFRGHSDTEVMLAAFERWGALRALERFEGMFAFSLWDVQSRQLTLARDRVGKKPLYFGWCGSTFLFGSELKALEQHPDFDDTISLDSVGQYLQYGWIVHPWCVYQSIRQISPGSYLQVSVQSPPWSSTPTAYWSAKDVAESGEKEPFVGSYEQGLRRLEELLRASVSDRMVADVELGALLSGGIDSSMVVAIMQSLSSNPVRTFSIGFSEPKFDEAGYAAGVAKYLGTEHRELYVTSQQTLDVVEHLSTIYDEPFSDPSQVPTYLVCQMAARDVKVVLSGDGGDETLAGYSRYRTSLRRWHQIRRTPVPLRRLHGKFHTLVSQGAWGLLKPRNPYSLNEVKKWRRKVGKREQYACNWYARHPQHILANNLNHCFSVDDLVPSARPTQNPLTDASSWARVRDPLRAMLHYDYIGYLPDDILVKVDRASMAVSLEVRSPLLDRRVLEFAWSLPTNFLIGKDGNGKKILKDLLLRHVPRKLVDRPKRGFGVPLDQWLRGPLRDWAEELISERALTEQGIFDTHKVRTLWAQHLCNWRNHSMALWSLLMFQAWWRNRYSTRQGPI